MDLDTLEIYNKLNRIKPSIKSLKYPFNIWNPEKIKITQREIQLKFKNIPNNMAKKDMEHNKKGGSIQYF